MARPDPVLNTITCSILIVFILCLPVDAQGSVDSCVCEIRVRKNTAYDFTSGSTLNIPCIVAYCDDVPVVKWGKMDHTNKFIEINKTNQKITQKHIEVKAVISHLIISNISTNDSGIYRCIISFSNTSSESHNINVNISDSMNHKDEKATQEDKQLSYISWFLYVVICLGILGLVMVVMLTSFLCISRCSRKSNIHKYNIGTVGPKPLCATTTSGTSQELPDEQNYIYDAPRDDSRSASDSLCASNDLEYTPDMRKVNRNDHGLQQIVYATLQHPAPREHPAVQHVSAEQLVEYASIRIA